eukprot:13707256-Heterocapsa_arctica.AAC.1
MHLFVHPDELLHCLTRHPDDSGIVLWTALAFGHTASPLLWCRVAAAVAPPPAELPARARGPPPALPRRPPLGLARTGGSPQLPPFTLSHDLPRPRLQDLLAQGPTRFATRVDRHPHLPVQPGRGHLPPPEDGRAHH